MIHGTLEWELQGGAGDVAIMGGPPAVHATPQLWHHQGAVQAACYSHGCSHLPHTNTVMSSKEEGGQEKGEGEGEEEEEYQLDERIDNCLSKSASLTESEGAARCLRQPFLTRNKALCRCR